MPKNQFDSENQPEKRRGKSKRNMLLQALENNSSDEQDYYNKVVEASFTDPSLMKFFFDKLYPSNKNTFEKFNISIPKNLTTEQKLERIFSSVTSGKISVDVGQALANLLLTSSKVKELETWAQRIEDLEKLVNADDD